MNEFRSRNRRSLSHRTFKDEEPSGDFRNGIAIQVTVENVHFNDSPMDAINFTNSAFLNSTFTRCSLKLASFNASIFKNCLFEDCDLDQASFRHVSMDGVQFVGGRAEYAVFEDAKVKDLLFDIQLHGADLRFAYSENLSFGDSNLWGAAIKVNCGTFADVNLSRRSLELFVGLLSKTAGNEDLTLALDGLISPETRGVVKRIVRSVQSEKVA